MTTDRELHPFFKTRPAIVVYFQMGAAALTVDALGGGQDFAAFGVFGCMCALFTLWAFACFAEDLRIKGYSRGWAWLSLLSIAGLFVLWSLPTRPQPQGFQIDVKPPPEPRP